MSFRRKKHNNDIVDTIGDWDLSVLNEVEFHYIFAVDDIKTAIDINSQRLKYIQHDLDVDTVKQIKIKTQHLNFILTGMCDYQLCKRPSEYFYLQKTASIINSEIEQIIYDKCLFDKKIRAVWKNDKLFIKQEDLWSKIPWLIGEVTFSDSFLNGHLTSISCFVMLLGAVAVIVASLFSSSCFLLIVGTIMFIGELAFLTIIHKRIMSLLSLNKWNRVRDKYLFRNSGKARRFKANLFEIIDQIYKFKP